MKTQDFLNIQKNDKFNFTFNSSFSSNNEKIVIAAGKPRYSKKYNLHKLTLKSITNLNGCKFYAYLRGDNLSFAFGDMAISKKQFNPIK